MNEWSYVVSSRAERDLARVSREDRRRVFSHLDRLVSSPTGLDTRRLKLLEGSQGIYRLRAGDLRVLVELDADARVVRVLRIRPRGRAYR